MRTRPCEEPQGEVSSEAFPSSIFSENQQFADDVIQNDDDDLREKFYGDFRQREPSDENRKNREFRKKREKPAREKRRHLFCKARRRIHSAVEHPRAIREKLEEHADDPANRVVGENSDRREFVDGDEKKKIQEKRESAKKQIEQCRLVFFVERFENPQERKRHDFVEDVAPREFLSLRILAFEILLRIFGLRFRIFRFHFVLHLQNFFQASFQRHESHRIVKRARAFVAFPNVERDIVEAVRLREIQDVIVKRSSDVLAAQILVNAKVVDVKRLFRRANIVVRKILHDAKRVALNEIGFVHANENRAAFVAQNFFELRVIIFLRVRPPQIRPPLVVHHQHLFQKPVQTVNVFFFSLSNHDSILLQARIFCNRVLGGGKLQRFNRAIVLFCPPDDGVHFLLVALYALALQPLKVVKVNAERHRLFCGLPVPQVSA